MIVFEEFGEDVVFKLIFGGEGCGMVWFSDVEFVFCVFWVVECVEEVLYV